MHRSRPPSAPAPPGGLGDRPRRRAAPGQRAALALLLGALLAPACGTLGYGLRSLAGGAGILLRREPVERVLARPDLPPRERERLALALALRDFAVRELGLPDNASYRTYVRLGREVATWNVVAAPALSVEPRRWCFPVAGCVSYRGYFREASARRFAAKLARRGDDVAVAGAAAYSTLGWFADPLLDTFLDEEPWRLAGLLFHELAHQVVYLPGDTAFNESFASAVEETGVAHWVATRQSAQGDAPSTAFAEARQQERLFVALLLAARSELAALYAADLHAGEKLARKRGILGRLGAAVDRALDAGDLGPRYAGSRGRAWNNADLAARTDYALWVPAFRALFAASGSFRAFYGAARALAALPPAERRARLEALAAASAPGRADSATQ
jgi:predicted aminopeptidase